MTRLMHQLITRIGLIGSRVNTMNLERNIPMQTTKDMLLHRRFSTLVCPSECCAICIAVFCNCQCYAQREEAIQGKHTILQKLIDICTKRTVIIVQYPHAWRENGMQTLSIYQWAHRHVRICKSGFQPCFALCITSRTLYL